jgi:hypothetical protein
MFSHLLDKLRAEITATEVVLSLHERLRDLLFPVPAQPGDQASDAGEAHCIDWLNAKIGPLPNKLDWQVYDHSASIIRLYAAYEQFVNDLVSEYVRMLPTLYRSAVELPECISVNHRIGLAQILIKIGAGKQYKDIEEAVAIRALSAGLGEETGYSLIPGAFLVDRVNYRMEVLAKIWGDLNFNEPARQISNHKAVVQFMKTTRGESDTPQSELENFVKYRNEASHGTPEQILAPDEIRRICEFIVCVGEALAYMVEEAVTMRHLQLGNSILVAKVIETHYAGKVVVAKMSHCSLKNGDEVFVSTGTGFRRTLVRSLQINGNDVPSVDGSVSEVVGIALSTRVPDGAELVRVSPPSRVVPQQLAMENMIQEPETPSAASQGPIADSQ